MVDSHYPDHVAIGNEAYPLALIGPEIIVFHYHKFVSRRNLSFLLKNPSSDGLVVHVCPSVAFANNHGVVRSVVSETLKQQLLKLFGIDSDNVIEARKESNRKLRLIAAILEIFAFIIRSIVFIIGPIVAIV